MVSVFCDRYLGRRCPRRQGVRRLVACLITAVRHWPGCWLAAAAPNRAVSPVGLVARAGGWTRSRSSGRRRPGSELPLPHRRHGAALRARRRRTWRRSSASADQPGGAARLRPRRCRGQEPADGVGAAAPALPKPPAALRTRTAARWWWTRPRRPLPPPKPAARAAGRGDPAARQRLRAGVAGRGRFGAAAGVRRGAAATAPRGVRRRRGGTDCAAAGQAARGRRLPAAAPNGVGGGLLAGFGECCRPRRRCDLTAVRARATRARRWR